MTVSTTISRKAYAGDGGSVAFPTTFEFFDAADLTVILIDSAGTATVQTLTTHYTVSGGAGSTGTVTMVTAPASGETLVILLDEDLTQTADFTPGGTFPASSFENALDRLAMVNKQQQDAIDRSIKQPAEEAPLDMELPNAADRAGKFLAFGPTGEPSTSSGTGADSGLRTDLASTTVSEGASLVWFLNSGTSAEARTVQEKLEEMVVVTDFGASTANSAAENTAKIQAAIDDATTRARDLIVFPLPGTFDITNLTGLNGKRLVAMFPGTFLDISGTTFEIPGIEGTFGHLNLYVDVSTGSDSTNCGITSSVPFATIQQALDFLPANINHDVVINIANGTYSDQGGEDEWGRPVVVDLSKKSVNPLRDTTIPLNTKAAKIILRGASEAGTIIDGTAIGARYGVWVHGTKDVQIESLTLTGSYAGIIAHQGADITLYDVTTTGNDYGRIIESQSRMEVIRGTNTANGRNYYIKNGQLQENDSTISAGTTYNFEIEGAPFIYLLRVTGGVTAGRPYLQSKGAGVVEFDACDIDGGATFAQGSLNTLIIRNGTRIQNFTSSVFALDHGYVDAQGTVSHIHGNAFVGFTSKGSQILNLTNCDSLDAGFVDDPNTEGVRCGGHANTAKLSPNVSVTGANKILTRPTAGLVFKGTTPPTDANTFYELGAITFNEAAAGFATPFWVCTTRGYGSGAVWTAGALYGSATYDPPSLADGAGVTTTVTVTGAALGDFAQASFSLDLQGITVTAYVSSADTVSVRFQNEQGATVDLGSGTLRARVSKF